MGTFPQSIAWTNEADDQGHSHCVPYAYWSVGDIAPRHHTAMFHAMRAELVHTLCCNNWRIQPGCRREKAGVGPQSHRTYVSATISGASSYIRPANCTDPEHPRVTAKGPVAMLICEPSSVPDELHDTDTKASIIHVKSPAHHAKLIYPVVRAVLMRWDEVGMRPADSTIRTTANQYGTGDVTLAHVLAGATSHHDLDKARRADDDHLQGVTSTVTPPPQAALGESQGGEVRREHSTLHTGDFYLTRCGDQRSNY